MDDNKLTKKQQQILDFLTREINEKGYPPSVREICSAVGLRSTSTVHGYLKRLEKKGIIIKDPTKPRALKIVDVGKKSHKTRTGISKDTYTNKEMIDVPIVGKVTAGQPILAVENIEDTFPIPIDFIQNTGDLFMLRVQGESMIEAGILDGDLILVKPQNTALNGDIVVALIGDEATVKRFYHEKDHIRLQPENRYMDPIIIKDDMKDNLSILGKVIGVFRRL